MDVLYNDIDLYCNQWARNLMAGGILPKGAVDERSIEDIEPRDLEGVRQAHFFSGFGGWPYALELAGWGDREVWTGSCPCQPFSGAGKRQGEADQRHLWPAFFRLIAERRPATIFGEQTARTLGREWLAAVRVDLEEIGYVVGSSDLAAASIGAPHPRQRVFWVAHAEGDEQRQRPVLAALQLRNAARHQPADRRSPFGRGRGAPEQGGLANPAGSRGRRGNTGGGGPGQEPGGPGPDVRLGDAHGERGQSCADRFRRRAPEREAVGAQAGAAGFAVGSGRRDAARNWAAGLDAWKEVEWIPSGPRERRKLRPVESRLCWLADGVSAGMESGGSQKKDARLQRVIASPLAPRFPGRLAMLRAYGNAVVPQVAAVFVRAAMESLGLFPVEETRGSGKTA